MNNRLLVSVFMSVLVPVSAWALTVTCSEGGLEKAVTDKTVSELTISGAVDVRDFCFMAEEMPSLTDVDMSAAVIKGYTCAAAESYFGQRGSFAADAIPAYSFFGSKLKSIKLPASLKVIGVAAFAGCKSLGGVEIPSSVETVGNSAFYSSAITAVNVPVKQIGEAAFAGCVELASVKIGSSVETVGNSAFAACPKLEMVEIAAASQLSSIGDEAFAGTSITSFDFARCQKLVSVGKWAFANTRIAVASLPKSLTDVPEGVYFGSGAAKTIIVPDDATVIGDYAYCNIGVTSATIPAKVEYIGDNAFDGARLTELISKPLAVPSLGKEVFKGVNSDSRRATLYVNENLVGEYSNASQWREFAIEVDPGLGVEYVAGNSGVRAHFDAAVLHIEAGSRIETVLVADEAGRVVASLLPLAEATAIDTHSFGGHMYVASVVLADGSVHKIKLLRK